MSSPGRVWERARSAALAVLGEHPAADKFLLRLDRNGTSLMQLLEELYADPGPVMEAAVRTCAEAFAARSDDLHALDHRRLADPDWFRRHTMVGGDCYVDGFAGTLNGLAERIPYLQELGITYLHLMPLYRRPAGPNDGGYAISSYREVAPELGTMEDLQHLGEQLRAVGISLSLDFTLNHTAFDHPWARAAISGDPRYRDHYFIFEDRSMPDVYDRTLREIFPDEHSGSFTEHGGRWVWTTFHDYQWDLNYANPAVFTDMLGEMLFLANVGAEILRLDAVAFVWKSLGTSSENLPEAHRLVQALNACRRIAAPAMIFKSEAIVHPDQVVRYFGTGEQAGHECETAYNPLLMAASWQALADGDARLLTHSLRERYHVPGPTAWINYVRSHDDIGWGFADEDAAAVGLDPRALRNRLNAFYTGGNGWARGRGFQHNPDTGDMRVAGTAASLAGLEAALADDDQAAIDAAIRRLLLLHGIAIAISGIPLLHLGDEIGMRNDYGYETHADRAADSRWLHRPDFDWEAAGRRRDAATVEGRLFSGVHRLLELRRQSPPCGAVAATRFLDGPDETLAFRQRWEGAPDMTVIANFSPDPVVYPWQDGAAVDLITGEEIAGEIGLDGYQLRWLQPAA